MRINVNKHYVYAHYAVGYAFYIGKGTSGRIFSTEGRSDAWKAKVASIGGVFSGKILSEHDTAEDAHAAERDAIAALPIGSRIRLVNVHLNDGWRISAHRKELERLRQRCALDDRAEIDAMLAAMDVGADEPTPSPSNL